VSTLEGARAKLTRAQEHFDTLRTELASYASQNPVTFASQHNMETNQALLEYIYTVDKLIPPPDHWSLLIGDLVHNLRSALDHGAWSLVCAEKGEDFAEQHANDVSFPICSNPERFAKKFVVKQATAVQVEALRSAQPFIWQKQEIEIDALWVLHRMSIVDKHRELHVVNLVADKSTVTSEPHLVGGKPEFLEKGPLREGMRAFRFTALRPTTPGMIEVSNRVSTQIGIRMPGLIDRFADDGTPLVLNVTLDESLRELVARTSLALDALEEVL
jgi:hypothetical protein